MAAGDADKTEKPTPKRKKEARKEGQIPKTPELGMWIQILVASFATRLTFGTASRGLVEVRDDWQAITTDPDPVQAVAVLGRGLGLALVAVLPLMVLMVVVGIVAMVGQTGLVIASKAAKPKFSKVNPISGLKAKFKPAALWQGGKSLLKVAVLTAFSWEPILDITRALMDAGTLTTGATASAVVDTSISLAQRVAFVGLVIAGADYAFQRSNIAKQLRMSKKDIKEEAKQAEGSPEVKGEIKRRMQAMGRNRMLAGVADASVVIVNPTHIAVAIRYSAGRGAPVVVAKGRGHVADRIREEAGKHFVPIVRDVPLARTLEKACKVDQAIPPDLYEAVARLLAFVMQVGRRAALLGGVLDNPAAARLPLPAAS